MNTLMGKDLLMFVLEPGNIEKLKQGKPISQRLEDFFPDGIPKKLELVIHFSSTPIADAKKFAEMSKMTFDERTPVAQKMRPHCAECKSTIEQVGVWRSKESPVSIAFCPQCGTSFGIVPTEIVSKLPPITD